MFPKDKINTKGFKQCPENINNKGRPRRLFSVVTEELKKQGYKPVSKDDIRNAYEQILNLPYSEILLIAGRKVIKNEDELKDNPQAPVILSYDADKYPFHFRQIAKALLSKKGFEYSQDIIDRIHGKATQHTEVAGDVEIKEIKVEIIEKK
jgi:hypothetical protein